MVIHKPPSQPYHLFTLQKVTPPSIAEKNPLRKPLEPYENRLDLVD